MDQFNPGQSKCISDGRSIAMTAALLQGPNGRTYSEDQGPLMMLDIAVEKLGQNAKQPKQNQSATGQF